MKKFVVFIIFFTISLLIKNSHSQMYEWTTPIGNRHSMDFLEDRGSFGMFAENEAISYVTGQFTSFANFGNYNLTSNGGYDIFFCKIGNNGNIIWAVKAGSNLPDSTLDGECGYSITGDNTGALYLTGKFNGNASFGTQNVTSFGGSDMFLAKYNPGGNVLWVKKAGGTGMDVGKKVVTDASGNVYVVGRYYQQANFDGTIVNSNSVDYGVYIAKYNSSGTLQWVKSTYSESGNNHYLTGNSIAISGNYLYITGVYLSSSSQPIYFGSTQFPTPSNPSGFARHIYLAKFDIANGNCQWIKAGFGDDPNNEGNGVDCDAQGNVYITGTFRVYLDFGAFHLTNAGVTDAYIVKYNSSGIEQWAKSGGGLMYDYSEDIKIHNESNPANSWFYIVGNFFGPSTFGSLVLNNTYPLTIDTYGIKYDLNGNAIWAVNGGSVTFDRSNGATITPKGNLLYTGNIFDTSTFGWQTFNTGANWNMYVTKVKYENGTLITGVAYVDANNNCQKDAGEVPIQNIMIKCQGPSQAYYANTDDNGIYKIYVPVIGAYQVSVPNIPFYYNVCPILHVISVSGLGLIYPNKNFGFHSPNSVSDLVIGITNSTRPRPGFCYTYLLKYENVGTVIKSGTVTLDFPAQLNYQNSIPSGVVSGNTVTWNYSGLLHGQSGNIIVNFCVPANVPINTQLCVTATVNPVTGDQTPYNNVTTKCDLVRGSYDPNDKNVDHSLFISPQEISEQDSLTYTIRFQNTGNAEAYNIFIVDTISPKLDLGTLEVLQTSHPMYYETDNQRIVTFYYENIMLPDSNSNEPASHGFVKYRIKPLNTLVIGDTIKNLANIYFDLNAPVVTNTAVNIVGISSGIQNKNETPMKYELYQNYPNPFNPTTSIKYQVASIKFIKLAVYDILGKEVATLVNEKQSQGTYEVQFDGSKLTSGIYFYKLQAGDFSEVKKMILLK